MTLHRLIGLLLLAPACSSSHAADPLDAAPACGSAAECTPGFFEDLNGSGEVSGGYLIGQTVLVPRDATLASFGLIARASGTHATMGLYTDVDGFPQQLIAKTNTELVESGRNDYLAVPVSTHPLSLAAGSYWIMAMYDADTEIAKARPGGSVTDHRVVVASWPELPETLAGTTVVPQNGLPALNYYVVMAE